MLFAYAVSGNLTLTNAVIAELQAVADHLAHEYCPQSAGLGFVWGALVPGDTVNGSFLRGYDQVEDRTQALWLVQALRRFSERFPALTIYLSGWGELPMTQLKAGQFELFADTYDTALAVLGHTHGAPMRRRDTRGIRP
jgi:hypothetical protein